jgi:hypothetical protein
VYFFLPQPERTIPLNAMSIGPRVESRNVKLTARLHLVPRLFAAVTSYPYQSP